MRVIKLRVIHRLRLIPHPLVTRVTAPPSPHLRMMEHRCDSAPVTKTLCWQTAFLQHLQKRDNSCAVMFMIVNNFSHGIRSKTVSKEKHIYI